MRILVTGSTSQQANVDAHRKSTNFTGMLWDTLRSDHRNEVFWKEPSVTWDSRELGQYDHIFLGIAAPLSLGANRIYGALSVLEQLWGDKRLTLILDQPDADVLTRGLRSVRANNESFTKPFFSYRKEYELARDKKVSDRLDRAVELLLTRTWPRTIAPGLPWTDKEALALRLPFGADRQVQLINLDHQLVSKWGTTGQLPIQRLQQWAFEKTTDYKWVQGQNLGHKKVPLIANHRVPTDHLVIQQLRESTGFLAGPTRGQVWWTPRVAMALSQGTPVFTDWQAAAGTSPVWAGLPATHELRDREAADYIAKLQLNSYLSGISKQEDAIKTIYKAAGVQPTKTRRSA